MIQNAKQCILVRESCGMKNDVVGRMNVGRQIDGT